MNGLWVVGRILSENGNHFPKPQGGKANEQNSQENRRRRFGGGNGAMDRNGKRICGGTGVREEFFRL